MPHIVDGFIENGEM